jgi:transcriptional regulator with XRE-family HTH domain
MDIAAAIRSRRLELGLTQGEVAFLAGMHRQGVVRLETKGNIPSIATLLRIAAALDLSAVELITSAEEYQP